MADIKVADVGGRQADDTGDLRRSMRPDMLVVAGLVPAGSRVLDVGCADGALLHFLTTTKQVDGRGIELSQAGVEAAARRGLSVVQGDADRDLAEYPSDAFDVCILSQTIQATHAPRKVLENLLRIGKSAIVSLPNFGYWRLRWKLVTTGRMPVTDRLPDPWYATPNIHFCTIADFLDLCRTMGISVREAIGLDEDGRRIATSARSRWGNLKCAQAVFLLTRPKN